MEHDEELTGIIVYEALLEARLKRRGLRVERQKIIVFTYDGMVFNEGLRLDLLVKDVWSLN